MSRTRAFSRHSNCASPLPSYNKERFKKLQFTHMILRRIEATEKYASQVKYVTPYIHWTNRETGGYSRKSTQDSVWSTLNNGLFDICLSLLTAANNDYDNNDKNNNNHNHNDADDNNKNNNNCNDNDNINITTTNSNLNDKNKNEMIYSKASINKQYEHQECIQLVVWFYTSNRRDLLHRSNIPSNI